MSPRIVDLSTLPTFTAVNLNLDQGEKPGPVIVQQCAQIRLAWGLADGKTGHNILYGKYAGAFAGTQAQANAITTALTSGAAWTTLAAFFANTAQLAGVDIRDVNTKDQPIISPSVGGSLGTSASPELPDETAIVLTLRTAKTGRGNRGRAYIPGWATNALGTGNIIAPAVITALNAWALTIFTAFNAQGYQWVLGQKERLGYTSPGGVPHDPRPSGGLQLTSATVRDNHWDTQRRRGLK